MGLRPLLPRNCRRRSNCCSTGKSPPRHPTEFLNLPGNRRVQGQPGWPPDPADKAQMDRFRQEDANLSGASTSASIRHSQTVPLDARESVSPLIAAGST